MGWTSSRVTLCRDGLIVWTSCRLEDLGGFWISAVLMTLDSNCRGHSQMWQSTMLGPWIFPACTYVLCSSWMQKDREKFKDALDISDKKDKEYAVHNMQTPCYKSCFFLGWLSFNWTRMYASKPKVRATCSVFPRPGMGCGSFRRCRASKVWDLCRDDTRDFGFGWCEQRGTSDDLLHWWHSLSLERNTKKSICFICFIRSCFFQG